MIRFRQLEIGKTFIYYGAKYIKTRNLEKTNAGIRDYGNNCVRLDNGKEFRIHGSCLVKEVA